MDVERSLYDPNSRFVYGPFLHNVVFRTELCMRIIPKMASPH